MRSVWRGQTIYVGAFVRGDSGFKSIKGRKGIRFPFVPGAAAYNANAAGMIAFAGLTMDDVKKVVCSSYMDVLEGMIEKKVDIAFCAVTTPKVREVFASPSSGHWLPMPLDDKAAWERLHKFAPWIIPIMMPKGIGPKVDKPIPFGSFPYSIFAYDHLDPEVVYAFVKAMHQGYDTYKGMHKVLPRWTLKQAVTDPSPIPYHKGAIRYFKEAGVWTPEMDKWQAEQLKKFNERSAKFKKSQ